MACHSRDPQYLCVNKVKLIHLKDVNSCHEVNAAQLNVIRVSALNGSMVGLADDAMVGVRVGMKDGSEVGVMVGTLVGVTEGAEFGVMVGTLVEELLGLEVRVTVGLVVRTFAIGAGRMGCNVFTTLGDEVRMA